MADQFLSGGHYKYYDSDASKLDGSAYLKATYTFASNFKAFADLQYRHVGYKTTGINDKFYSEGNRWYNQNLDIDETYDFLNPKLGLSWVKGASHVYASAAMSHREPSRDNFTDNYKYPFPKAESVLDYEAGYNYTSERFQAGANLYYMDYTDKLVLV